jgi:hypothetical protein
MSTASISVLVAALAVITGAIFQYLTIRTARLNTVSQLRASVAESRVTTLRDALAEYMTLTYFMDLEYGRFQQGSQKGLTEKYYERAEQEDRLYNLIRLHLDVGNPDHDRLLAAIEYLRSYDTDEVWIERRDKLVETARAVFEGEIERTVAP